MPSIFQCSWFGKLVVWMSSFSHPKERRGNPPPPRKKNQQIRQHLFKRVTDWEVNINDVNPYVMYIAKKKMSTSVVKAANNNK